MKELIEEIEKKLLYNEANNCIYKEKGEEEECINENQTNDILLKSVEEDRGQMDNSENPSITFPAALINIQKISYESTANFVQKGDAVIIIRLFDENENSIIWDLMENTNKRLHGRHLLSSQYGALHRTKIRKIKREDAYTELELHYSLQFMDTSCMRMLHTKPSPDPKIKVKILELDKDKKKDHEKDHGKKNHHSWNSTESE